MFSGESIRYYDGENGTDVWSGGSAGMQDDARRMKFKRRLQEIAGGVCQAVRKMQSIFFQLI
jgi:hypothetical protein